MGKVVSYYYDLKYPQAREMKAVATAPDTASAVAPEHVQVETAPASEALVLSFATNFLEASIVTVGCSASALVVLAAHP